MDVLERMRGGLVVSCQADEWSMLREPRIMACMARDAEMAGAIGIRANGVADIRAIKQAVSIPVIGIIKRHTDDCEVFITQTVDDFLAAADAGAEIVAFDATGALRRDGLTLPQFVEMCRALRPEVKLFADCASPEQAKRAAALELDIIAPTLVGYTQETKGARIDADDFAVLKRFLDVKQGSAVIAEGNIDTPGKAQRALELGCHAVVVGNAITNVAMLTQRFVAGMHGERNE